MDYLKISNDGEIDIKAFEKIGISTKKNDDSKIGEFGSGLNYAIAWLIRNKIDIKVYSGLMDIEFGIVTSSFRNTHADFITINGRETSFCVDMGGDVWEPWMVIREIYCNALDEDGSSTVTISEEEIKKEYNKTNFYIQITEEIKEVIENWDDYYSFKRKDLLYTGEGFKIYTGNSKKLIVYRKGIKCYEYNRPCVFHYDIDNLEINESRIVKDSWTMDYEIAKILATKLPEGLVDQLLYGIKETHEFNLYWDGYGITFNDNWQKALENKRVVEEEFTDTYQKKINSCADEVIPLPKSMVKNIVTSFAGIIKHVSGNNKISNDKGDLIYFSTSERVHIDNIILKLRTSKFWLPYKIRKFIPVDKKLLSSNDNKEIILLSERLLEKDTKIVTTHVIRQALQLNLKKSKYRSLEEYFSNYTYKLLFKS